MLALLVAFASLAAGVVAVAAWLWATRQRTSIPGPPTLPLLGNATMFYKLPVLLDRLGELSRRYGDIFRVLAVAAWLLTTQLRRSIPRPPPLPLLGNATMFYILPVLRDKLGDLHHCLTNTVTTLTAATTLALQVVGKTLLYVGPKLVIVVSQPDDVQKLLATTKPRERDPYITYLLSTFQGNGILVSKGQVWKNHRRAIERGFHSEELEKFMDAFNEGGSFLCERLAELNGAETEISVLMTWCSLRTLVSTIFSLKPDTVVPDLQEQVEKTAQLVDFAKAFAKILYRPWTIISFFKWVTAEGQALITLNNLAKDIVSRGIALTKSDILKKKISERSLLTWAHPEMDLGFPVTEKDIYDEAVTLISAGIETTSDTIGYLLCLLGLHPEWQDKAQRELDDVFGNGEDYLRPATTEDITRLTVLDAIVKETLRLFPTVPSMPYLVTEDTPLAGGHYVAPHGSTVLVAYYLIHRHPQLFPEPLRFDPGRFLDGGSATSRKPYSYIPFGVGPRKCVGGRFAVLQIKTVLAMVLRRYNIQSGSSRKDLEESVLSITATPLSGFRVTCVPRKNTAV